MSTKKTPFIDMHLHVLPGIDDGSKSVEQSLAMLHMELEQGCAACLATPHYYPKESINSFLARRQKAVNELLPAVAGEFPGFEERILPAAEVFYHRGLAQDPDVEKLCIGKSRFLLLEMPFQQWSSSVLRDVETLQNVCGIRVIIAHYERFLKLTDKKSREALLDMGVLVQMNMEGLLRFMSRRTALKLIRNETIDLLGTDSHNTESRPPDFEDGMNAIRKAGEEENLRRMLHNAEWIFSQGMGE